jgi:hypothetical protein
MSYYYSFPESSSKRVTKPESDEIEDALEAACRTYDDIDESNWRNQTGFLCEKLIDSQRPETNESCSRNIEDLIILAISERPDQYGDKCANIFDNRIKQADITEITEAELEVIASICHFRPIAFEEYTSRLARYLEHYPQTADINKAEYVVYALWGLSTEYPEKVVSELEKILIFAGEHCDKKISWPIVTANTLMLSYELITEYPSGKNQIHNHVRLVSDCLDPELPVGVRYQACRLLIHSNADQVPSELNQLEQQDEYIRIPARLARLNVEASGGVQQRIQRKYRESSPSIEDGLEDVTSSNEFRRLWATHWLISRAESNPEAFSRYHSRVLELVDNPDPDVAAEMIRLYTIIAEETTARIDYAQAIEELLNQLSDEEPIVQESVLRALCLFADQEPNIVMETVESSPAFNLHNVITRYTSQYDKFLVNLLASLASVDAEKIGKIMNYIEWFTSDYFINWKDNGFYTIDELLRLLNRVNTSWQEFSDILVWIEDLGEQTVTEEIGFSPERLQLILDLLLKYYDVRMLELDDISPYFYTSLARLEKEPQEIACKVIRDYQKKEDYPILTNSIIVQLGKIISEDSISFTKRVCSILSNERTIQSLAKLEALAEQDSAVQVQRIAERKYKSAPDPKELTPDPLSGNSERAYLLKKKSETAPEIVLKSIDELYELAMAEEYDALRAVLILSRKSPEEVANRALKLTKLFTTSKEVMSLSETDFQAESIEYKIKTRRRGPIESWDDVDVSLNIIEGIIDSRRDKAVNIIILKIICNVAVEIEPDYENISHISDFLEDSHPQIRDLALEIILATGHVSELKSGEQHIRNKINTSASEETGVGRGIVKNPEILSEIYNSDSSTESVVGLLQEKIPPRSPDGRRLRDISNNNLDISRIIGITKDNLQYIQPR